MSRANKEENIAKATEIINICNLREYQCLVRGKVRRVRLDDIQGAEYYSSSQLAKLSFDEVGACENIEVTNSSAIADIWRLSNLYKDKQIGVLNFASSHSPGGGFINGAMAQEEALCHASTLYYQLKDCLLYSMNKKHYTKTYTDNMAFTKTQFFVDSNGNKRVQPVTCDVVTSAAVNLRLAKDISMQQIEEVMRVRMHKIIQLFIKNKTGILILGAFGCGVFMNDPRVIAKIWKDELSKYGGYFDRIVFSIMGSTETVNYKEFADAFTM